MKKIEELFVMYPALGNLSGILEGKKESLSLAEGVLTGVAGAGKDQKELPKTNQDQRVLDCMKKAWLGMWRKQPPINKTNGDDEPQQ